MNGSIQFESTTISTLNMSDANFTLHLTLEPLGGGDVGGTKSQGFNIHHLLWGLHKYGTPIIILVGLLGNVTSFLVFIRTHVKRLSSSVYLAALAIADTGFLLQLFVTWLGYVRVFLFHMDGWCQTFVYLSYVCSFLSVWYVVGFTVERYIAVCYPLKRQDMCTSLRAKKVVLFLALFACLAYSFAIWTSGVVEAGRGRRQCQPLPHYRSMVNIFNNVDTVITLIIPFIWIFVLNVRLAIKIKYFYKKRLVMTSSHIVPSHNRPVKAEHQTSVNSNQADESHNNVASQPSSLRPRSQISMTRMLLVVSSMFLVLNLPSHVVRVHYWVMGFVNSNYTPSTTLYIVQQFFTIVYYCNFSINFFLYSLCGKNFRSALYRMFKCQNSQFRPVHLPSRAQTTRMDSLLLNNTGKSFTSTNSKHKQDKQNTETV